MTLIYTKKIKKYIDKLPSSSKREDKITVLRNKSGKTI
jgi:hypothetical protein